MLQVVCIQAGNYCGRGAEYVNTLFDMVRRNLPEGYPGCFTCFTDDPGGLDGGILVRPLPAQLEGWWSKLALFRHGLFAQDDRILFFDLDTIITGSLRELCEYRGPLSVLRDFYRPNGLQSSVMAWDAGEHSHIWESFVEAGFPRVVGGDQTWIEREVPQAKRLQDIFPSMFASYKQLTGIPLKASVVVFHGQPRPHEVSGWASEVWKKGGLTHAELIKVCNTRSAKLAQNVVENAQCGEWLDYAKPHDAHAVIVGGGTSLLRTFAEMAWRESIGQTIWALNGSAKWLRANGIAPHFHVIVDARPTNVEFVLDPHLGTHYLIASQCDPAVLRALEGMRVTVWHSAAEGISEVLKTEKTRPVHLIGGGTTVGMQAMVLAHVLGFRKIHLYGFDSSVSDTHHAYTQPQNDADTIVDVLTSDGAKFRAAPWMVEQAREFCALAPELADGGSIITVSGDGLLPHLARQLMFEVTPADVRAWEILKRLDGVKNPVGVELGVFGGDLSKRLLARDDVTLHMIDRWVTPEAGSRIFETQDFHATLTNEQQEACMATAKRRVEFAGARAKIIRGDSSESAKAFMDGTLDFVFVDADHSYEGCMKDILAWERKVKPGGWLCGHDYKNYGFLFGKEVERAVDEFVLAHGHELEVGENYTWFIRMPERAKTKEAA